MMDSLSRHTERKIMTLVACLCFASALVAAEDPDLLRFYNSDTLHGTMLSAEGGKSMIWKRQDARKELKISPAGIRDVRLTAETAEQKHHSSSARLTNGDLIRGDLVSLDASQLIIDTWYAGRLAVNRLAVQSLFPGKRSSLNLYEGPNSLEEWTTTGTGAWRFSEGALYSGSSGTIGKEVKLPPNSRIDFDIHWKGTYPQFRFAFYTDNLQSYSRNAYVIRASSSYVRLYRYRNNSSTSLASAYPQFKFNKGHCHYTILTDKKAKTISVLIDDKMVKQWSDASGFEGMGTGILFYGYSNPKIKVSGIRVAEWDGTIPGAERETEAKEGDYLELTNHDRLSGKIQNIAEGNLSFETSYATLTIPIERVSVIAFSEENAERARRNANDIEVRLASGGAVTLDMQRIADGKIHGNSENFGAITLALQAVDLLRFNIYKEQPEEEDSW